MEALREERKRRLDDYEGGVILSVAKRSEKTSTNDLKIQPRAEFRISRRKAIASGLIRTTLEEVSDASEDTTGWDENKLKNEPFPEIEIPLQVTSATSLSLIVEYLQGPVLLHFEEYIISEYGMNELINVIADANYLDIPYLATSCCNYIGRELNIRSMNGMMKWLKPTQTSLISDVANEVQQDMKTEVFLDQKDTKISTVESNIVSDFQKVLPSPYSAILFKGGRFVAILDRQITRSSLIDLGNNYPYAYAFFTKENKKSEKYIENYTQNARIILTGVYIPDTQTNIISGWFLPRESKDSIAELEKKSFISYSNMDIRSEADKLAGKDDSDEKKIEPPKILYLQYQLPITEELPSKYNLFDNRSKNAPKSYLQKFAAKLIMSYPQFPEVYLPQVLNGINPSKVDIIDLPEYVFNYYTESKKIINLGRYIVIPDLKGLKSEYETEERNSEERHRGEEEEESSLKDYFMSRARNDTIRNNLLYTDETPFQVGIVIDIKPRRRKSDGSRFYKSWKLCCILRNKYIVSGEYDAGDMIYPKKIKVASDTIIYAETHFDQGSSLWVWNLENLNKKDSETMPYGDDIFLSHINIMIDQDNSYGGITFPSPERKLLSGTYHYVEDGLISRSLKDNKIVRQLDLKLGENKYYFPVDGNRIYVYEHPGINATRRPDEYEIDIETLGRKIIDNTPPRINRSTDLPLINRRIVLNGYSHFVEIRR